ncbi:MAG: hypothetical protein ACYS76_14910 [Planctomycetota bacterium]
MTGQELWGPDAYWDLAFELTTKEPDPNPPPPSMDFDGSGIVDFRDFALFANKWLTSGL